MQGEDIFLGQNDLGKIFILLNSLEKSGFREKKSRYAVNSYAVIGFTNNPYLRRC